VNSNSTTTIITVPYSSCVSPQAALGDPILLTHATLILRSLFIIIPKPVIPPSNMLQPSLSSESQSLTAELPAISAPSASAVSIPRIQAHRRHQYDRRAVSHHHQFFSPCRQWCGRTSPSDLDMAGTGAYSIANSEKFCYPLSQVVSSFVISSFITTACTIFAVILDGKIPDEKAFLSKKWQEWPHKDITEAIYQRSPTRRRVLDRLILGFANQQLATGMCLLVSGYIMLGVPE